VKLKIEAVENGYAPVSYIPKNPDGNPILVDQHI
jgi:hypothetical protein